MVSGPKLGGAASTGTREKHDFYPTPEAFAGKVCQTLAQDLPTPGRILDAGCGDGVWARAARAAWPDAKVWGIDLIDREPRGLDHFILADFLGVGEMFDPLEGETFDLVIGNPPFKHAEGFARRALKVAPRVAYLLPLAFVAGRARRAGLFREQPLEAMYVCAGRPFVGFVDDFAMFLWASNGGEVIRRPDW